MVARERIFGPFGLLKWDFIHSDRECFDTGGKFKGRPWLRHWDLRHLNVDWLYRMWFWIVFVISIGNSSRNFLDTARNSALIKIIVILRGRSRGDNDFLLAGWCQKLKKRKKKRWIVYLVFFKWLRALALSFNFSVEHAQAPFMYFFSVMIKIQRNLYWRPPLYNGQSIHLPFEAL